MADSTPAPINPDYHKRVGYRDCPYYIAHLDEKAEEGGTPDTGDTTTES